MFQFAAARRKSKILSTLIQMYIQSLNIYGKKQSDCTLQMPPDDSIKKGILQVTIDCAQKQTPNIVISKSSLGSNLVS
jgi:hypothetical protein